MNIVSRWLMGLLSRPAEQAIATDAEGGQFCYDELWPQVVQLIQQQRQTVTAGRWLVSCDDSVNFLVALLAVTIDTGTLVLPVNASQGGIDELKPEIDGVITDQALRGGVTLQLPMLAGGSYSTSVAWLRSLLAERVEAPPLRLFTSGSTGKPKPIDKPLALLLYEVEDLELLWGGLLADRAVVSTVSAQHVYGLLFRLLWPLTAGRVFHRHNVNYPEQLQTCGNGHVLVSSPALLSRLQGGVSEQGFTCVFSSGGPLAKGASDQALVALGTRPVEVFGSSETGGIAWRQSDVEGKPWRCFAGLTVARAEDGRLLLNSPYLAEEDNPRLLDDLIELVDDRHFKHCGRSDSVVKIAEKRVSLLDINHRLNALEQVEQAYSIALLEGERDEVVAVLVLSQQGREQLAKAGKNLLARALRAALREHLEPAIIPRRFRYLASLPYNSQGKLSKQFLIDLF